MNDALQLDMADVLAERAAELAREVDEDIGREVAHEVVVVEINGDSYGLPATALREIVSRPSIAGVPGITAPIRGIAQVRGELISVVSAALLLGRPDDAPCEQLAVIEGPQGALGLLIGKVAGVRRVHTDELANSFSNNGGSKAIVDVTTDLVAIIDVEALLADPRIIVKHA